MQFSASHQAGVVLGGQRNIERIAWVAQKDAHAVEMAGLPVAD